MIVERLDPLETNDLGNKALHLQRYSWAARFARGGEVLDIACGVGYGSAMLAKTEGSPGVLGVDRCREAIALASTRHGSERVFFLQIEDVLTFTSDRRFELVVCLETLEHVSQPAALLRQLYGLLQPGGTLVVSAPVRESPGDNPHHLHCFTHETLRALVAEGFEIAQELEQSGAYLTVAARRRDVPCLAWAQAIGSPRVTVSLVTFNTLDSAIDLVTAIRAFTRPPYDLRITDNASSDGTRSFLRLFEGEPGFSLVLNQANTLCARATNQAIDRCRTEFLIYLCASHALVTEPNWDERLVESLKRQPDAGIAGDVWNPGFPLTSRRYAEGWTPEEYGLSRLLHVQGGAWVARRSLFEEVGTFAEDEHPHSGMDVEFSYRLLSLGKTLGACSAISCPPAPRIPQRQPGVCVYHPASAKLRAEVRSQLGLGVRTASASMHAESAGRTLAVQGSRTLLLERTQNPTSEGRPLAIVFCERLENESFCVSVIRELSAYCEVRPCGPGWPVETLADVDTKGARFYLELDAASGSFVRPDGLSGLSLPKFAWLIDTHKKPTFHRSIAQDVDLCFYANQGWGHVLPGETAWLPVHADSEIFFPRETQRDLDLVFVGSQAWRADPLKRIAQRHGLRLHVSCTTGPREKSETAAHYARAKLVFNRHVTNDLNFRVVEAMACGRVVLTDAQYNGQYDLFEDGRHYVLYKDEADLQRHILRLLADDKARTRIEREAARHALEYHSTRARVAQLHHAIESFLARGEIVSPIRSRGAACDPTQERRGSHSTDEHAAPAPWAGAPAHAQPRRWLVLADEEPTNVSLRSYTELLAMDLQARGHAVTIVRTRRRQLHPAPPPDRGQPRLVEVDLGPLPEANRLLVRAAPLATRLDAVVREHGPFDAVLAEGPLGALVGVDLAGRLGLPLTLALERCEVARRGNRLTREQLYAAELEHWGARHAVEVWTASETTAAAVRRFYEARRAVCVEPPTGRLTAPKGVDRFLKALGLEGSPALVVLAAPPDGPSASLGQSVLFVEGGLWLWRADGATVRLSSQAPRGPALAALLCAARIVATACPGDLRAREAEALGARVLAWAGSPEGLRRLIDEQVVCGVGL